VTNIGLNGLNIRRIGSYYDRQISPPAVLVMFRVTRSGPQNSRGPQNIRPQQRPNQITTLPGAVRSDQPNLCPNPPDSAINRYLRRAENRAAEN